MMIIMRYQEGHNDAVRARIIAAAARTLRRHGLDGVSIPALMKEAGLTHGAFYVHFKNRDELVEAAVMAAASETEAGVFAEDDLAGMSARYLSLAHVQHPERGCVLAALGSDGVRQRAGVRAAFGAVARGFLRLTGEAGRGRPRSRATAPSDETIVRAATMIGAVILARLVADDALAERILSAARRAVAS